jgi:hypothetical protein
MVAAANAQVTVYNNLSGSLDDGYFNWDGGSTDEGGASYGSQTGQVFTDSSGVTSLTSIESIYVGFEASSQATNMLVQLFNFSGGVVGSMVGQQTVSPVSEVDSAINSGNLGGRGLTSFDITANMNISGLVSGQQYLVVMQGQGANVGYQGVTYNAADTNDYVRDFSSFGNPGVFGITTWTEAGSDALTSGDTLMKVTGSAAPEPASICALGLGVLAVIRRRRK